jgi:hypothetical protein
MCRKGSLYESDYQTLSLLRLLKKAVFGSKTPFRKPRATFLIVKKIYNPKPKNTNFDPSRCESAN